MDATIASESEILYLSPEGTVLNIVYDIYLTVHVNNAALSQYIFRSP